MPLKVKGSHPALAATCNVDNWMQGQMREHPIGRWAGLMKFELINMSEVALTLSTLMEVADSRGDREHLGFLDASQEAHPPLKVEVLIAKVIKFLCTQQ